MAYRANAKMGTDNIAVAISACFLVITIGLNILLLNLDS
jgi:hypothetical protein